MFGRKNKVEVVNGETIIEGEATDMEEIKAKKAKKKKILLIGGAVIATVLILTGCALKGMNATVTDMEADIDPDVDVEPETPELEIDTNIAA